MIYAVNGYFDQIRPKEAREYDVLGKEKYIYFDTENEARAFVRKRSLDAFYAAEAEVEKARKRHNRNCKKYPPIKSDIPPSTGKS